MPRNDQWKAPTPDLEGHRKRLREALGNTLSDEFVDVILGKLVEALRPGLYDQLEEGPGAARPRRSASFAVEREVAEYWLNEVRHNHVLHEKLLLVAVTMTEPPRVSAEDRAVVTPLSDEITRVQLNFGFMEHLDVPKALELAVGRSQIAPCDPERVTYFTGHETIIPTGRRRGMARWRKKVFAFMHHNAQRAGAYFKIPTAQIMEIGIEFEM